MHQCVYLFVVPNSDPPFRMIVVGAAAVAAGVFHHHHHRRLHRHYSYALVNASLVPDYVQPHQPATVLSKLKTNYSNYSTETHWF